MSSTPGFLGPEQLPECLKGCDVVVIPAGVPRKPGMFFQGFTAVSLQYFCSRGWCFMALPLLVGMGVGW